MDVTFYYLLIFGSLVSVSGAGLHNPVINLIEDYYSLTEGGIEEIPYDIGVMQDLNTTVSSTMIKKIFLWTLSFSSGQQYELLDLDNSTSITTSHFLTNKPTFILIHGFLGDGLEPWIISIKDELLAQQTCNVVSVQWPSGHEYFVIDYYHVAGHVPIVGAEIANLLYMLAQFRNQKNSAVHIIGHSLGAHIAGFVGKNVDSPIARISGLDPAGLTFHDTDPSKRLDRSDAIYVDVIHSNGCRSYLSWTDCFGIDIALGHTDFWPNGGRHQPACHGKVHQKKHLKKGDQETERQNISASWSVGCDHMMSHTYFLESLQDRRGSDKFRARPCDSYRHYKQGNCSCGDVPQYMGFHSNPGGAGDYYLNTSSTPPYGLPDPDCPGWSWQLMGEEYHLIFYILLLTIIMLLVSYKLFRRYLMSYLMPPPLPKAAALNQPPTAKLIPTCSSARPGYHKCWCGKSECTAKEFTAGHVLL